MLRIRIGKVGEVTNLRAFERMPFVHMLGWIVLGRDHTVQHAHAQHHEQWAPRNKKRHPVALEVVAVQNPRI